VRAIRVISGTYYIIPDWSSRKKAVSLFAVEKEVANFGHYFTYYYGGLSGIQ